MRKKMAAIRRKPNDRESKYHKDNEDIVNDKKTLQMIKKETTTTSK